MVSVTHTRTHTMHTHVVPLRARNAPSRSCRDPTSPCTRLVAALDSCDQYSVVSASGASGAATILEGCAITP